MGQSVKDFNFRSVTSKFNDLVYQYPIRIPERYSLVIRCAIWHVRKCVCGLPAISYVMLCSVSNGVCDAFRAIIFSIKVHQAAEHATMQHC